MQCHAHDIANHRALSRSETIGLRVCTRGLVRSELRAGHGVQERADLLCTDSRAMYAIVARMQGTVCRARNQAR